MPITQSTPITSITQSTQSTPITPAAAPARPTVDENPPGAGEPTVPLKIEDWLTVLTMAALALMTFANVLVRYFTNASFAWTEEFSVFLMIVLSLVAGSAAVARERHIRIEFFANRGSAARQRRLAQFGALMVALLFFLMAVLSLRMAWDDFRFEETSPGIGLPQWWYSIWLPIFALAIALRALGLLVRLRRAQRAAALVEQGRT